jgi:hypothetical protein
MNNLLAWFFILVGFIALVYGVVFMIGEPGNVRSTAWLAFGLALNAQGRVWRLEARVEAMQGKTKRV